MAYKQIHLHLSTHPVPTSLGAIDYACALADLFEAKLNATSPRVAIKTPVHWHSGHMMVELAREIEAISSAKAGALEAYLTRQASALGVAAKIIHTAEQWPTGQHDSVCHGRTSDLCVLGLSQKGADQKHSVEEWLFGAGRPCLLFPDSFSQGFSLERVLISWDFSRSAARAVCDALPMLRRAKQVRFVTVRGEKDIPLDDVKTPLIDFLAAHGVAAVADEIDAQGMPIGGTIIEHARGVQTSLLIMGAFGHSRLKEFVLGGATREMLDIADIPLLMSH